MLLFLSCGCENMGCCCLERIWMSLHNFEDFSKVSMKIFTVEEVVGMVNLGGFEGFGKGWAYLFWVRNYAGFWKVSGGSTFIYKK